MNKIKINSIIKANYNIISCNRLTSKSKKAETYKSNNKESN